MSRVRDNWERLVRATLRRDQLRATVTGVDQNRTGISSAVPESLGRSSNIDAILLAADEIQDYDPTVARILCEQAYSMAQDLDPNSDGRGVVQFKTGLMSIIKQRLAKRDGGQIDRSRDVERLWKFYRRYKERHRLDERRRDEQKLQESGVFSSNYGGLVEMAKASATLKALLEVLKALSNVAAPEVGNLIMEEVRRVENQDAALSGDLTPYNIVPLEAPSLTNAIGLFPEVKAAISAISYTENFPRLPTSFKISGKRNADMFDLLEYIFGFQRDNIRNQRENVILSIANAQSRLGFPDQRDPKIDEKAVTEVYDKVLDNYFKWCKYLRKPISWNSDTITWERKLLMVALYFLIWGEAANVRFLPECICYILHNMAMELNVILNNGEAVFAESCKTEHGSCSFLEKVICPIYEIQAAETVGNRDGKAAHSAWRNYDDFNEYFWSNACFKLGWPMKEESPFLRNPLKGKRTAKSSFVEHRTFFHLYRSFHRMWILLFIMFQALTIIAFSKELKTNTFKILLSVGPVFAVMNLMESCLDILLMFGAYTKSRGMAISRLVIKFFWWFVCSVAVIYFYVRVLQDWNKLKTNSLSFRIYITMLAGYAGWKLLLALISIIPACHAFSEKSDQAFFQFFKWFYQERYFVGRGLFEKPLDYASYVVFWLAIFACKFTFAYFFQIRPLVRPTIIIVGISDIRYSWHSFVSKRNHNALTIASLWAPVVAIYLMDIHIWYTLLSALIGGFMGAKSRLGEIRSIEMVHERFESFPEAFVKNMSSPRMKRTPLDRENLQMAQETNKTYASMFAPFWNEIITSLREEDFIGNREKELLAMPTNTGTLPLVQWPLFLLSRKILMAIDLAKDCKDTQADLWNRICSDGYMAYAVQECYYGIEKILHAIVNDEGRHWVQRIYHEINSSLEEGSLHLTVILKKIPSVQSRFTALAGLLMRTETPDLASGAAKALYDFYEVVTHDLLSTDLREQIDTLRVLTEAKNAGCLFSTIKWPKNPEINELVKRLHLLLTVKDTASHIPKNLEAKRRLEFFTNSLFMDMPPAKPVCEMLPFCVFTPYYDENVLYSFKELEEENEDGVSTLYYLQKIFPDEWENFWERINEGRSPGEVDFVKNPSDNLELRFWVSYRGQTLARTVRGMMYYRRALMLQSFLERRGMIDGENPPTNIFSSHGFELSSEARAQADLKFTYVVSCQKYGEQRQKNAPQAADISLLLQRNEALRVAYIHLEECDSADGKTQKGYYSKLVKGDLQGKDQEIYSIKLPGNPKLGEGKPENQNHAIVFTRGDAIQTIDMNQDNYLEEAMKMRNLLQEFHENHGIRPPTILGVREHVFTGSVSSLAWFMSNQETSFVTLGQRVLAKPLKVRMHYGHPDVFDRIFHITRGGVSKASRVINISEDIFAGFNSTLRQGNITHHEYIQVGKGRDVGLNQIALFEGKVAGGNGEQVLSRDVYRLGQLLDFFRMLSFYYTTVGFYVCTMMVVLTVYVFLYGRVYMALSGLDEGIAKAGKSLGNTALSAVLTPQFLVQIGIFTAIPMIMGFILELGLLQAVFSFLIMQLQLCSVFFTFSLGTRTHYFGRTILHGGAKYRATGRGFVVQHIKFADNYRLYSRSHFVKALEIALLLIVYIAYGYSKNSAVSFVLLTLSSWFLVFSWLFAPYIFNPSGFEWQKTVDDFDDWANWLLYKGGVGIKGEKSWESWWEEEQMHIRTWRGRILETLLSLRFFMFQYGIVFKLHIFKSSTSLVMYGVSWIVLVVIVTIFKIISFSPKKYGSFKLWMRFFQGLTALVVTAGIVLSIVLTKLTLPDFIACILAFISTGWGILSLAITWKKVVKAIGLWDSIREFARIYDTGMGTIIFAPVAFLSWFPFVSTFQSRLLYNHAFSRGLEISKILAGNKANV